MNFKSLKQHINCISCLLVFITTFPIFAQQNFNDFKSLVAVGNIPADFSSMTYSKINEDLKSDRTNLKGKSERVFLEGIHYSIDELLHSGRVVYGDEISEYVTKVAHKLLKGDATLKSKLRFYTIKSNTTNAFSTDQGIVFVTTGLIAQLTSEAQLAFVLAHEISHYTEKHVVETFDWKQNTARKDQSIEKLSQYSKEKEFDADRIGLSLYKDAGYSKEQVLPTFDVLMFSYLPFDEIEIPRSYFSSENMYVPSSLFSAEKYPIKAEENEDDTKSSHPNIRKRKEAMESEMAKMSNWGVASQYLGEEKFKYIREISRFESIRTDVLDANYADALYSIFILEKQYPNSIYLKRMKAKAWLGIAQLKEHNRLSQTMQKAADYEGEIAQMYYLFRNLDKIALITMCLRQVEDIRKAVPTDREIQLIWERMVKTTASTEKFDLKAFSTKKYAEAELEFEKMKTDTVSKVEEKTEKLSKYDKIKKKKNQDEPENFDPQKFYLYGISDLLTSEKFLESYSKTKKEIEDAEKEEEKFQALKSAERKKINQKKIENQLRVDAADLIFVEPIVYRYSHREIDLVRSEKLAEDFANAIQETSKMLDMNVTTINSSNLKSLGTPGFNERAILMSYLSQITFEEEIDVFPVDFTLLEDIKTNYGTSKVMFSILEHSYHPDFSASLYATFLFFPVALVILPLEILNGNQTELNVIIMDIDKGGIVGGAGYNYNEPLSKLSMSAHIYDVLEQVKSKPL